MDAKKLKGIPVVSLEEGTKLGEVTQPLLDLAARKLRGMEVEGDDGTFIVPFELIQTIGHDAITIRSSQATQTPETGDPVGTLKGLQDLEKLEVVDNEGTFLGTLDIIEFDPETGLVTKLSAHKGGMLGIGGTTTPLDASSILKVGPELLTVTMPAGHALPAE
jgi:sporulation protein YlmC with PRC-barrel domain